MTTETLETMAAALEASGDYKILRRLQQKARFHPDDGTPTKIGIFLDLETTGLDPTMVGIETIDLCMLPFRYTADGRITDVLPPFNRLREPSKPIPPAITKLTGIDDAMVKGHVIDPNEIAAFIAPANLIVAHNARFDRRFAERLHVGFERLPWACSMTQAPWSEAGFEGTKLAYLLNAVGVFHDGHRAHDDCRAALEILVRPLETTGKTAFAHVLDASRRTTVRIWATGAPYEVKDLLRSRLYRWNPGTGGNPKAWYFDADAEQRESEIAFLRDEIFGPNWNPSMTNITALDRFSDRI